VNDSRLGPLPISPEVKRRLKAAAAYEGMSMQDFLAQFLDENLPDAPAKRKAGK